MYQTAKLLKDSKEQFATKMVETLVRHQDRIAEISTAIEIAAGFMGAVAKVVKTSTSMLRQDPRTRAAVTALMSHVVGDLGNRLNELSDVVSGMVDRSQEFGAAVLGLYDQVHEFNQAYRLPKDESSRCQCGALRYPRRSGGYFRYCLACMEQMAADGKNRGSCFCCGEKADHGALCPECSKREA